MKTKDTTVQCIFHQVLTAFLFGVDLLYREWGTELVITSGSEPETKHSRTSLHYSIPSQAADIRIWEVRQVPTPEQQFQAVRAAADIFCDECCIPRDWIDIVLVSDHIHIEYQPKRQLSYHPS